ncbi:DsbA family oxidoreductase [Spirillospora sp. NPDC048911]|uniref:DsbA family oxidoreductase n=1 Tax=Spirillospora sp. NPDC048911 TaxID=3364527 RepID=UPI00371BF50A
MSDKLTVEVWTDINCPFCYVGEGRLEQALEAFPHRDEVEVVYRSFELNPEAPKDVTRPVVEAVAEKYGATVEQIEGNEDRIGAMAAEMGLDYRTRGRDSGNSFDLHRLTHYAKEQGKQRELFNRLYKANFAEERSVFADREFVVEAAGEVGLDPAEVRKVLDDPAAYAAEVRADEREAAELGARGVPFFVLDRKYGISGAQPTEVFSQALDQAWSERPHRSLITVEGTDDAEACGPNGC